MLDSMRAVHQNLRLNNRDETLRLADGSVADKSLK